MKEVVHEDESIVVPDDTESVSEPCFAEAARSLFWTHPRYMSVSIRDMICAEAIVWMSAIHDLKSMRKVLSRTTAGAALDAAISEFEKVVSEFPEDIKHAAEAWVKQRNPDTGL